MTFRAANLLIILCLSSLLQVQCRSRKHSEKLGARKLNVIIDIKNLDDVELAKLTVLDFELRCTSDQQWTKGNLTSDHSTEVSFLLDRAKSGDSCDMRVLHPNPPGEFEFMTASGVVYEATDGIKLGFRAGGQLASQAVLRRTYKLRTTDFHVKIPVVFKSGSPRDLPTLVAELKCSPEFEATAKGIDKFDASKMAGEINFTSGAKPGVEYTCRQIQLSRGTDKRIYYGDMNAVVKQSKPNEEVTVADAVQLQEVEVVSTEGLIIIVTPGAGCKTTEVFDVDLGKCIPKPD